MRSNRKVKYKPKYFPFSAGIPWKVERGKYIIPEIDAETWNEVLKDKNIHIVSFGGALESFFSLSAAEAIFSIDQSKKLYWIGNAQWSSFCRAQGLCKISPIDFTKDLLSEYPVPLFFDKDNNAYFNVLNNYLVRSSYWGLCLEKVESPVLGQIFRNVMIPWNNYCPKLRSLNNNVFDELCKTGRVKHKSRVITLILDKTECDLLEWNLQNVKEFAQLVSTKDLKLIVFTKNIKIFYGTKIIVEEYNLDRILSIISNSWMILSNTIDWLLISMMLSKAKIIGRTIDGSFNLIKNAEIIESDNEIFTSKDRVSPIDAFTICQGLL